MADKNQDPLFELDFSRMLAGLKRPGFDIDAMISSQRKNIDAVTTANRRVVQSVESLARRQREILRETMSEASHRAREVIAGETPEQMVARQADLAKAAFEKAVGTMTELADMVSRSCADVTDVIDKRVSESLNELKAMLERGKRR